MSVLVLAGAVFVERSGVEEGAEGAGRAGTSPSDAALPTTGAGSATTTAPPRPPSAGLRLAERRVITATAETGPLSPKSIVASGTGVVYAQNMIYNHSVTAFDADGDHLATISDEVDLASSGIDDHPPGSVRGGPVELAFSPDRTTAYVSNYSMYGPGFTKPGDDECSPESGFDSSFVYRIDVASHAIDQAIPVGSVPKYVAATPDGRHVLVTNWCTYDPSVIDAATGRDVRRVPLGPYPRGIAVSPDGRIAKVDTRTGEVVATVATGSAPRSMDIAADGQSLYVVNYGSATVSKVTTADMVEVQEEPTGEHPIGVTYDPLTGRVWVACYSGQIQIFDDR